MISLSYSLDSSQIRAARREFRRLFPVAVFAIAQRAVEITRDEAPKRSRVLESGIRFAKINDRRYEVEASAVREPVPAQVGVLHLASGKTRPVEIAAQPRYDYARDVGEGTGLYGVRGQRITPRRAGGLLIPVDSVPAGESFITAGGRRYIVRSSAAGQRANPFGDRAADRLAAEVEQVTAAVFAKYNF